MIAERLIREALAVDPLEQAKDKVQTRKVGEIIRKRQAKVHAALKRGVPTEGDPRPADYWV